MLITGRERALRMRIEDRELRIGRMPDRIGSDQCSMLNSQFSSEKTFTPRLLCLIVMGFACLAYAPLRQSPNLVVPATVRVRLFAIEQPAEIRVTNADGQTILINSRINSRQNVPFRSSGPVTIDRK